MTKKEITGIQNIEGFLKDLAVALPSNPKEQHRVYLNEDSLAIDVFLAGYDIRTIPLNNVDLRLSNYNIIGAIIELINIELRKEYQLNDEATKD